MEYTTSTQSTRGVTLTTVHFTGTGKERRWAVRMDRFYAALTSSAAAYSRTLEPYDRYVCWIDVEPAGDEMHVSVSLSHKRPGCKTARRQLHHLWRRGILWLSIL